MEKTSMLATLAEAEEDEDEADSEDEDGTNSDTFDVPHLRYIDDDSKEEEKEGSWVDGSGCRWYSRSPKTDCWNSSSYRYVVVSGTPLKILEHLLSDLRLDDQRGAQENRESGKFKKTRKHICTTV